MFEADEIYKGINPDIAVTIDAEAYALTASDNFEDVWFTELQLLDIVPRSLGVLVNGINMLLS